MNSERNSIINEVNWNILVTSGKEIKRDSMISVNESRAAYINIRIFFCYFYIFYAKRQRKYSNRRIKQVLLCLLNN